MDVSERRHAPNVQLFIVDIHDQQKSKNHFIFLNLARLLSSLS
jgi:hypothetical protein